MRWKAAGDRETEGRYLLREIIERSLKKYIAGGVFF